ncbi:MAG: hypothetical protein J3Q66DRAFT_333502 [Benniella sp.]|nr:MAG: hypothetical protein J3Q66DRAFT_333502 [Benniella sp.]
MAITFAQLPLECLQLIIAHFARRRDTRTLARLLRVNRRLCHAALPYLYADPFHRDLHKPVHCSSRGDPSVAAGEDPRLSAMTLIKLLLQSANPSDVTPLLKAAYVEESGLEDEAWGNDHDKERNKEEKEPPSGINYLQHLRHFCSLESDLSSSFLFRNKSLHTSKPLRTYLAETGTLFQYRLQDLKLEDNPFLTAHNGPEVIYLSVDLRVQLTWALCSPILENIQSLVIPLSDIQRYNTVIQRFKSLNKVIFKLDRKLSYQPFIETDLQIEQPALFAQIQRKRTEAYEGMISFVREHCKLFPRQLQFASCPEDTNWNGNPQRCPESYQHQLSDLLPSVKSPRELGKANWAPFLNKIDLVDLKQVEEIHSPCDDHWSPPLQILERMPRLQVLDIASVSSWTFDKAPKTDMTPTLSSDNHDPPEPPFPPLRHVRLKDYDARTLGNELGHLLTECSKTLESLTIYGYHTPNADTIRAILNTRIHAWSGTPAPTMCLLQKIVIHLSGGLFSSFPLKVLENCPMLEHLELEDGGNRNTPFDVTRLDRTDLERTFSFSQQPHKSKLKTLRLQGSPALKFYQEALKHMPALETLYLGTRNTQHLRNSSRTVWSWNWQLPNLRELHLTGEFARRFQFSMLAGCPSLESLLLDMTTKEDTKMVVEPEVAPIPAPSSTSTASSFAPRAPYIPPYYHQRLQPSASQPLPPRQRQRAPEQPTYEHQRVIQLQDFSSQDRYLNAPRLRYLLLHGRWSISADALLFMFTWVMPNLTVLSESQCFGFSAQTWIRATGRLDRLRSALSTRMVSEKALSKLGMERYSSEPVPGPEHALNSGSDSDARRSSSKPVLRVLDEVIDGRIQPSLDFTTAKALPTTTTTTCYQSKPQTIYSFNNQVRYVKRAIVSQ